MAAHSGEGGVDVDGDSATMTKSLRKRTTAARFEARVEAVACSRPGTRWRHAPELGSRTAGCGDGKVVSRAIEEAEVSGHHYT
jgi:hypothetical protein